MYTKTNFENVIFSIINTYLYGKRTSTFPLEITGMNVLFELGRGDPASQMRASCGASMSLHLYSPFLVTLNNIKEVLIAPFNDDSWWFSVTVVGE